jgi:Glyoxalase-like domain
MLTLDHLALSCGVLADGVAHVEAALGVAMAPGGAHPHMGTHNQLLSLGDIYLEVIAIDPSAPGPSWPRWFDLDHFMDAPRLTNWVAACNDLGHELTLSPPGTGQPVALARGDFRWQMAVPPDGCLPFDGCFPALIQWQGTAHPAARLPDMGIRLTTLEIAHSQADALRAHLAVRLTDRRVQITHGPVKAMRATFATPHGPRSLG